VRSLRDLEPGQELECFGTRDSQKADVFLGGERVGILTGTPEGFESADGSWTINTQRGFLRSTEIVTERARDVEVARCEENYWSESPFVFPGGRAYFWEGASFSGISHRFQRNGMPVLTFTMPQWWAWSKVRLVVTVEPGARSAEHDLPILLFLGCRIMLRGVSRGG
jgi:hypothetical protein